MKHLIVVFACLIGLSASAQPGYDKAIALKKNIVRVIGSDTEGFGFIVSVRDGYVYIITANHVVKNSTSIKVKFYHDQAVDVDATDLGLKYSTMDISLLKVKAPTNLQWDKNCYSDDIKANTAAWFVGKNGKWWVPTGPAVCAIQDLMPNNTIIISSSTGSIEPGTSGAPLITAKGIVGLIYADQAGQAEAYSIATIKGVIIQVWDYSFDLLGVGESQTSPTNVGQTDAIEPVRHSNPESTDPGQLKVDNVASPIGNNKWTWTIFVNGGEALMNSVKCVQYKLHPTFPNPIQKVCERGNTSGMDFPFTATGWGTFKVVVTVMFKDGKEKVLEHELKFSK